MPTSPTARSNDHVAASRRLKRWVVLLFLSNIALGICSFYLLRKTDRRYHDLIESSLPILGDLQDLTMMSVQVMRLTNAAQLTGPAQDSTKVVANARKALEDVRACQARVLQLEWVVAAHPLQPDLQAAGDSFLRTAGNVVAHYAAGRAVEAVRIRDQLLRPEFDRYLASIAKVGDSIEEESRKAGQDVSERARFMSNVVLSFAGWPVMLLVGMLVIAVAFVFVLMMFLRQDGLSSDEP